MGATANFTKKTQLGSPFLTRSVPVVVTLRHSVLTALMRIWGKNTNQDVI